jgi:hypothetical protein
VSDDSHYIRECPVVAEYRKVGKVVYNAERKITLPGGHLPHRSIPGINMKQCIDNYYKTQSIPSSTEPQVGVSFVEAEEDLVFSFEVSASPASDPSLSSSSESGSDLRDQFHSIRAQIESLEALAFQKNQRKEVFDGVHIDGPKYGPPKSQPQKTTSDQKATAPKIHARPPPPHMTSQTSQPPSKPVNTGKPGARAADPSRTRYQGPMKPVAMPPKPAADEGRFHYKSAIESSVETKTIVDRTLDSQITLSARELLAVSPDVRRQVRELVAGKRVSANTVEVVEEVDVDYADIASCFETQQSPPAPSLKKDLSSYAQPKVELRVIYPTFAPGIEPECTLDSGSQIVVMRRDIWEKLNVPINASKAIKMDSANNTSSMTLGMVENLPIRVGTATFYLQVHIVPDAPFEVLLGRPFFDVACAKEVSWSGGTHFLEIKSPETQERLVFSTQLKHRARREDPQSSTGNFQG